MNIEGFGEKVTYNLKNEERQFSHELIILKSHLFRGIKFELWWSMLNYYIATVESLLKFNVYLENKKIDNLAQNQKCNVCWPMG